MSDAEYVACNLCGSDETETLLKGRGPFQIVKCRRDGLVYMNPRPRSSDVRIFHDEFVKPTNLEFFSDYRRDILSREAAALKKMAPGGRLLDVGCATGTFFENFREGGWELHGVDTSSLGVELARKTHGAQVFRGTLREARFPDGFFDAVTVLDTIYYSPDPRTELDEYRRVLKDGGVLGIEIPGYNYTWVRDQGPVCLIMNGAWRRGFTESNHLYYFSPHSIRLLLRAAGFRLRRAVPEQGSLGRGGLARVVNEMHFACAKALFRTTGGRVSFSGKELYLATKESAAGGGS